MALADSGYYSEANLAAAETEGPELLIATANERDQRRGTHGSGPTTEAVHFPERPLQARSFNISKRDRRRLSSLPIASPTDLRPRADDGLTR